VPTTQRYFNKTDQVTALVRLYQPKGSMKPVVMTTRVTDRNGVDVINSRGDAAGFRFQRRVRSRPFRLSVPVDVAPARAVFIDVRRVGRNNRRETRDSILRTVVWSRNDGNDER
jgi:hypothetical protein